jgi:N-acylneuraminate cytidylyltransferase
MAWVIEAAKLSNQFERIIVSTDDDEIASIAKKYGAEVPYIRPAEISDDYATTMEVIKHAADFLIRQKIIISSICCIYPTAPLICIDDLKAAGRLMASGNWNYVLTVTEYRYSIFRALVEVPNGVRFLFPENYDKRSQDLPKAYHDAGQFYWGNVDAWLNRIPIISEGTYPLKIANIRVQDIDVPDDWKIAENIAKTILNHKN